MKIRVENLGLERQDFPMPFFSSLFHEHVESSTVFFRDTISLLAEQFFHSLDDLTIRGEDLFC
jgi:hypothetical protein